MSINIDNTRFLLQDFDFKAIFINELGWSNPVSSKTVNETIKGISIKRKPIAELSGASIFEIVTSDGAIPDSKTRKIISKEIQKNFYENVIIFIDAKRTQCVWHWLKNQDKQYISREHYYIKGQPGDLFISKLSSLVFDISEFYDEGKVLISDVAKRIKAALDIERVTKKFYADYQQLFIIILDMISGIDHEADKRWYASVVINRLMFIYFLQKKLFLDNGDEKYLTSKFDYSTKQLGENKFFSHFLNQLFFEGFAKPENDRSKSTNKLIGKIKYLNGGLFLEHVLEEKYGSKITIKDEAFKKLFELFDKYSWSLDDTPGGKDDEINPDVLGYIFEKYINQKAFGAYYTRSEITEFLCEQTIYKLILDEINDPVIDRDLLKKAGLDYKTTRHFDSITEMLLNIDSNMCRQLIFGKEAILTNLSLLDPACGSGAFLVAAMKTLIDIYSAILVKIDFLEDKKLIEWKNEILKNHPNLNYYIKKQIITNNLYGVDIMEEATEIAKLRLFLALVSSAQTVDDLEPLPNIDFNILAGNSLIGLMRVDPNQFDKQITSNISSKPSGKTIKAPTLFREGVLQGNIFSESRAKSYQQLINEREASISAYKNAYGLGMTDLQNLRDNIQNHKNQAYETLNLLLVEEFKHIGAKFEQSTWDDKKNKEGKPTKRAVNLNDIKSLEPFHWGYDFSQIFRKKNGFDAIITNPPWEVFKPNSKEFFTQYSEIVTKKKMSIKQFEKEKDKLLNDNETKSVWLEYLSKFPHVSIYFRNASQYLNQTTILNGKKVGSDINLYKVFAEQSFNLLKANGYCGLVIPSAIYSSLGTKQLRSMLFKSTRISKLISLSNEKFIFENVHHAFKFCFLTFQKDGFTNNFEAIFRIDPREAIKPSQLNYIFNAKHEYVSLSPSLIEKLSPDALSIMEFHGDTDKNIIDKMVKFPTLYGDPKGWELHISSEFHMTGDSYLFKTKKSRDTLPLYEGKMINQFFSNGLLAKYFINEYDGRKAILGKKVDDIGQTLSYQKYRFGFRAVAGNTNIRSIIVGPIPKNVFCGNSLLVSENIHAKHIPLILAFLNSFVVDFYARQMVTTNINIFYINQLPVPKLDDTNKWNKKLTKLASHLICQSPEFAELWEEVINEKWIEKKSRGEESELNEIRAKIDAIIAHVYELTEEEFKYILSTFPIVSETQKELTLSLFSSITKGILIN